VTDAVLRFRKLLWPIVIALAVVGLIVYAFLPARVEVDTATVERGSLLVTVDREGKTRVRERYVVSAPLAGRVRRIELHPGDRVEEGKTVLAVIEPGDPALLDPRARAEAEARVRAAEEAKKRAQTNLEQARAEAERARRLAVSRSISQEELERAEHRERAAAFSLRIAEYELALARAAFQRTQPPSPGENDSNRLELLSPITGCVLDVYQESSRTVPVGAELLKVGDAADLECVIDVLSTDAVKIARGAKVYLEHWGGEGPLLGRVRLVEPGAFMKVSALGVEEQRVNVLVDFAEPRARWEPLGDAYRVEARIVVWEGDNELKAPAGAFFRHGDDWAVFCNVNGRARLTSVRLGHSNGLETQILDGLDEGDMVILHPSDRIRDGVAVVTR
jgi:HlyD family secretion protein